MSSCINVYVVSLDQLRRSLGSGDQELLAAVRSDQEFTLSNADEIDDEAEFKCADVLAELVDGSVTEDAPGYLYGYALEALCAQLGHCLPNVSGIAGASEWLEEVDARLKTEGVPLTMSRLVFGGSPVPIPPPDDYPCIGHWTPEEIAAALPALQAVDLSDLGDDLPETFEQIRDWLAAAAKTPGAALVGFMA